MSRAHSTTVTVAAALDQALLADGAPVRRVKLLPIGSIPMRDGRGPYRIRDRAHAEQVVAATRAFLGSADFNFDYNHGVIKDGEGKASGWASPANLIVLDDGIYADQVEWTETAAAAIAAREYRYVSPLFVATKAAQGGDVIHLKNCALVNVGAIDLPAIAAGLSGEDEDMDELSAIAAALGLAASATVEEIAAAIEELKKPKPADISAIAVAAGLAGDATIEQVAAGVAALRAGSADMVPASVAEGLKEQVAVLQRDRLGREVDGLVAAGIVIPAKRGETLEWFVKDEVAARAFFKDMPAMIEPGAALNRKTSTKVEQLTPEQVAAAAQLGLSEADMIAALNEEA